MQDFGAIDFSVGLNLEVYCVPTYLTCVPTSLACQPRFRVGNKITSATPGCCFLGEDNYVREKKHS